MSVSFIISPETIFYDAAGTNIEFIYFPGTNKEFIGGKAEKQIKNLFDYMLEKFDHNDKDHLMDVYEIYQKIVQNNYKICEMTALIDSLSASENLKNTGTIMDFEEYGDTDVSGSEPQRVVIDDVVPEVIEEEEEVKNTNIIKMIKVIKLICVVLVGYFIVRVMFPSLMPLKINTNIAFVAAVAGIVVYIFSDKVPDKLLTHFVKKEYIQKYETQINYQPENDSNINSDVIEKENSHTQEYEHTMLLSDYMESIKKKEPEINLIYTGDEDMENISVDKLPCVVGSMEGRCNKVIHNRLVSHIQYSFHFYDSVNIAQNLCYFNLIWQCGNINIISVLYNTPLISCDSSTIYTRTISRIHILYIKIVIYFYNTHRFCAIFTLS